MPKPSHNQPYQTLIPSEYQYQFQNKKILTVFCSSSPKIAKKHMMLAQTIGQFLAKEKIAVIYGGGGFGMMGALAKACLKSGGEVVGVIPQFLKEIEGAHLPLNRLIITNNMPERKAIMLSLAQGFLILPGGVGTLEELSEVLSAKILGRHQKPILLFDHAKDEDNFWHPLLNFFDHLSRHKFVAPTVPPYLVTTILQPKKSKKNSNHISTNNHTTEFQSIWRYSNDPNDILKMFKPQP